MSLWPPDKVPCDRAVQEITDITATVQQDGMGTEQDTGMEHFVHMNTQVQGCDQKLASQESGHFMKLNISL